MHHVCMYVCMYDDILLNKHTPCVCYTSYWLLRDHNVCHFALCFRVYGVYTWYTQMGYNVEQQQQQPAAAAPYVQAATGVVVNGMGGVMPVGGGGLPASNMTGITRVYVGNLSWETEWQDLKDHMRTAGEVCVVCFLFFYQLGFCRCRWRWCLCDSIMCCGVFVVGVEYPCGPVWRRRAREMRKTANINCRNRGQTSTLINIRPTV